MPHLLFAAFLLMSTPTLPTSTKTIRQVIYLTDVCKVGPWEYGIAYYPGVLYEHVGNHPWHPNTSLAFDGISIDIIAPGPKPLTLLLIGTRQSSHILEPDGRIWIKHVLEPAEHGRWSGRMTFFTTMPPEFAGLNDRLERRQSSPERHP